MNRKHKRKMMSIPSVLVVPYPAQGHVNPLMSFSKKLVENGLKVIFLNTDFNHKRVLSSMGEEQDQQGGGEFIKLVSIPDGLAPEDDRTDFEKLCPSILNTMPEKLEKLIEDIHLKGEYEISFIVADVSMGWVIDVGSEMGINGAFFWPASAALFALVYNIPKLTHDGIIDSDGLPTTKETFQISPRMPVMDREALFWSKIYDSENLTKLLFNYINQCTKKLDQTEWWLCNTAYELEPGPLSFIPKLQPIGPLLSTTSHHDNKTITTSRSMGQFWEEDLSCMNWLDQQPHQSVVYVAFGSFTLFDQNQFREIALGIDLSNRPFLWVVRQDSKIAYPSEFLGSKVKIVEWAPQQKVLGHPAIACFVSHCGWNSTIEGLSNGVPFLCWPYFADQFYDKTFVCDELKVGKGFEPDENGVVSRWEIKKKVDEVLSDETLRSRSLELKRKVMKDIAEAGGSSENLRRFVKWLKQNE